MKKKLCIWAAALMGAATMAAQTPSEGTSIIQEKDTVWGFGIDGINLYEREMHRIDIAYQTKDPEGNPCRMSGVIIIPRDVLDGDQICDGMVLYNHYTQLAKKDAPSRGYALGEDLVLANPLSPNYILVIPDFYGFGITEDKDQWFCFGDANGHASIDCLLAAQELLTERGISQGKYLINAGYSSGGYDAIAAQKVRDMEYKDRISFDRTVVGGLPFDLTEAYSQYISNKDQHWRFFPFFLIVDSYNQHANLGFTPEQVCKPPYDKRFEEWIHSGKYTTFDLMKEMEDKNLADVIQEPFLMYNSAEYKALKKAFDEHALSKGWVPDPTQKYSVIHLYKDATVPVSSGRALLNFLSQYRYNGQENPFKKSIIPEKTHLTTNFITPSGEHTAVGGVAYCLGLAATMAALPVLYYDDELNTHYADLIKGLTPIEIVKALNERINIKAIIQNRMEEEEDIDFFTLLANISQTVDEYMAPLDLTFGDLLTMAEDSGLSFVDIFELYDYLTREDDASSAKKRSLNKTSSSASESELQMTPFLTDYYIKSLRDWYTKATEANSEN